MLSNFDAKNALLKDILSGVDAFGGELQIGKTRRRTMKEEIHKFREKMENIDVVQQEEIISSFTKDLKYDLCMKINRGAISKILFFQNRDKVFINSVVPQLEYDTYLHGSLVYQRGDHPDTVFFISDGRVNYTLGIQKLTFKSIISGGYFGEIEIFERTLRYYTVISWARTEVLTMKNSIFHKILKYFPQISKELYERAMERKMRDKVAMMQMVDLLDATEITKKYTLEELAGQPPVRDIMRDNSMETISESESSDRLQQEGRDTTLKSKYYHAHDELNGLKNGIQKILTNFTRLTAAVSTLSPLPPSYSSKSTPG